MKPRELAEGVTFGVICGEQSRPDSNVAAELAAALVEAVLEGLEFLFGKGCGNTLKINAVDFPQINHYVFVFTKFTLSPRERQRFQKCL